MLGIFHEHLSPQRFRFFPPVKVEIDERQVVKSVRISCSWTRVFETASETKRQPRRDRGKGGSEDLAGGHPGMI
jgi:hypothetical protein